MSLLMSLHVALSITLCHTQYHSVSLLVSLYVSPQCHSVSHPVSLCVTLSVITLTNTPPYLPRSPDNQCLSWLQRSCLVTELERRQLFPTVIILRQLQSRQCCFCACTHLSEPAPCGDLVPPYAASGGTLCLQRDLTGWCVRFQGSEVAVVGE